MDVPHWSDRLTVIEWLLKWPNYSKNKTIPTFSPLKTMPPCLRTLFNNLLITIFHINVILLYQQQQQQIKSTVQLHKHQKTPGWWRFLSFIFIVTAFFILFYFIIIIFCLFIFSFPLHIRLWARTVWSSGLPGEGFFVCSLFLHSSTDSLWTVMKDALDVYN